MDLTPRTTTDLDGSGAPGAPDAGTPKAAPTAKGRRRKLWPALVLAVVLGVAAFVIFQGLTNAVVYFCNADEVGAKSGCDAGQRFRLQGTVVSGTVVAQGDVIQKFSVEYDGKTVPVTYNGAPGGIFREGIPVVVEGSMGTDGVFAGDRVLVKHTEQYREANPNRVKDYTAVEDPTP